MTIDELIEETLAKASFQPAGQADVDVYLSGAEFGARYALQRMMGVFVKELLGLHESAEEAAA